MSNTGKARGTFYQGDRIHELEKTVATLRGRIRSQLTPQSISVPLVPNASPSTLYPQNFLPTAGGVMFGPIALNPNPASTTLSGGKGHLSITKTSGNYSSNVILTATASLNNLSYIDGAANDGQILIIHVPSGLTYNFKADGNLVPFGGISQPVTGIAVIGFVFDSTISPNGNAGGWVQLSGALSGGGGLSGANTALSNLVNPTAVNQSLLPDTNNAYQLGAFGKYWVGAFVNTLSIEDNGIIAAHPGTRLVGDFVPLLNNTYQFGDAASGLYWAYGAIYIIKGRDQSKLDMSPSSFGAILNVNAGERFKFTIAGTKIFEANDVSGFQVSQNIVPSIGNTYNLGEDLARFKQLFISGNIDFDGNVSSTATGGAFTPPSKVGFYINCTVNGIANCKIPCYYP